MINKRLLSLIPQNIHSIVMVVVYQWLSFVLNMIFIGCLSYIFYALFINQMNQYIMYCLCVMVVVAILRYVMQSLIVKVGYEATLGVKQTLRHHIYSKVLDLGMDYQESSSTSEIVQMAVEGAEQLEIYFGKYIPQLFYSLIAPLTLFIVFAFMSLKTALVLLICVPLIPLSIVAVQKFAKKLLNKYWGAYTSLGDSFLENLQGLTTLKIYQADDMKTKQMDQEAETFRKVTMRVLTMQLNSISVMDIVAFGGAALGIWLAIGEFRAQEISFFEMIFMMLLSSEFFIPLRLLGSYFHIAMNGMAASDKIFRLLDRETIKDGTLEVSLSDVSIDAQNLCFSYDSQVNVLNHIDFSIAHHQLICFVGESGCGKSTLASLLSGYQRTYQGSLKINGVEMTDLKQAHICDLVTLVNYDGYLFAGDLKYNLQMSGVVDEKKIWDVLKMVRMDGFVKEHGGLSMPILSQGSNLSGGQKQRLILARALLKDSPVYIFDEITSNIDVESENAIMEVIKNMKRHKTIIMITHRLDNAKNADCIFMMKDHHIIEHGTHDELYHLDGEYASLYKNQQDLLSIFEKGVAYE